MKLKAESLFLVGLGVFLIVSIVGLIILSSQPGEKVDTTNFIRDFNHSLGPKDAKVTVVEFADFQCPACRAAQPTLQVLIDKYQDEVRFVFKHFPLPSHSNAIDAALAAEAAGEQGKFWEYGTLLYDNQDKWSYLSNPESEFEKYAKELALDIEKFSNTYKNQSFIANISKDKSDGIDLNVEATPTFFINRVKQQGGLSLEEFSKKIDDEKQNEQ